jgi:hypothetical protein
MPEHSDAYSEEGRVIALEDGGDVGEPAGAPEDAGLISDTIAFINHAVSSKALETALLIGDYILTRFFNNDTEAAFSRSAHKPLSFVRLCAHPDLRISSRHLGEMVRVAAQERFLNSTEGDWDGLHYSHRLRLTQLPNTPDKIDLARQCIADDLTTRQLARRVKLIVLETTPAEDQPRPTEPDPVGDALTALLTLIDDTTRTLTAANLESFYGMIPRWSLENRGLLETRITALMNAISTAQHTWEHFLHQLLPPDGDH